MPGYGTTAVVRQWVDTLTGPVAWLSLDLLDHEPLAFWSHLLHALGAAMPGLDGEPSTVLWERGSDDPLFLSALVAQLTDVDHPVVLVLDGLAGQLDRSTLDGLVGWWSNAGRPAGSFRSSGSAHASNVSCDRCRSKRSTRSSPARWTSSRRRRRPLDPSRPARG